MHPEKKNQGGARSAKLCIRFFENKTCLEFSPLIIKMLRELPSRNIPYKFEKIEEKSGQTSRIDPFTRVKRQQDGSAISGQGRGLSNPIFLGNQQLIKNKQKKNRVSPDAGTPNTGPSPKKTTPGMPLSGMGERPIPFLSASGPDRATFEVSPWLLFLPEMAISLNPSLKIQTKV